MVAMAGVCPDVDGIGASFQMVTIYCRILLTDVTVNLSTIPTDMWYVPYTPISDMLTGVTFLLAWNTTEQQRVVVDLMAMWLLQDKWWWWSSITSFCPTIIQKSLVINDTIDDGKSSAKTVCVVIQQQERQWSSSKLYCAFIAQYEQSLWQNRNAISVEHSIADGWILLGVVKLWVLRPAYKTKKSVITVQHNHSKEWWKSIKARTAESSKRTNEAWRGNHSSSLFDRLFAVARLAKSCLFLSCQKSRPSGKRHSYRFRMQWWSSTTTKWLPSTIREQCSLGKLSRALHTRLFYHPTKCQI